MNARPRFPDRCSVFRRPAARRLPQGSVIEPASRRSQRSGTGTRYTDLENAVGARCVAGEPRPRCFSSRVDFADSGTFEDRLHERESPP